MRSGIISISARPVVSISCQTWISFHEILLPGSSKQTNGSNVSKFVANSVEPSNVYKLRLLWAILLTKFLRLFAEQPKASRRCNIGKRADTTCFLLDDKAHCQEKI